MSNTSVLHQWTNKMMLRGRSSLLERSELLEQGCFLNAWTGERIRKVGFDQYRLYQFDAFALNYEGTYSTFTSDLLYLMHLDNGWFWYEYDSLPTIHDDLESMQRRGVKEYTHYSSIPFLLHCTRQDAQALMPMTASSLCSDVLEQFYAAYTWDIVVIGLLVIIHFTLAYDEPLYPAPTGFVPDWSVLVEED